MALSGLLALKVGKNKSESRRFTVDPRGRGENASSLSRSTNILLLSTYSVQWLSCGQRRDADGDEFVTKSPLRLRSDQPENVVATR